MKICDHCGAEDGFIREKPEVCRCQDFWGSIQLCEQCYWHVLEVHMKPTVEDDGSSGDTLRLKITMPVLIPIKKEFAMSMLQDSWWARLKCRFGFHYWN